MVEGMRKDKRKEARQGRADDVVESSSDVVFEPSMDDDKVRIRFELTEFGCFV